jgi:adenylate kinase
MKFIILLGAPGSGKGTQASIIEKSLNFRKISTGEMLRNEVALKSVIGVELEQIINSGKLVPDEIVIKIIKKEIESFIQKTNGFILDGFPRTVNQAKALDEMLDKISMSVSKVIYLDIDENKLLDRISKRFVCKKCGENYNKIYKNTAIEGVCDVCGGTEFLSRADDNAETLLNRLNAYKEQTAPLLPYYQEQGKMARIDADQKIKEVTDGINRILV